jgi:hypothetical protein
MHQEPGPAPVAAPANRALPLILVAIVAGGLPLLWMNRAHIPMPKAWQIGGPNAAGSAVPVPPPLAPTAVPQAPPTSSVPVAPVAPVTPVAAVTPEPATRPVTTAQAAKPKPARPARPAKEAKPESRPCTEALAAVGLCDPKAAGK